MRKACAKLPGEAVTDTRMILLDPRTGPHEKNLLTSSPPPHPKNPDRELREQRMRILRTCAASWLTHFTTWWTNRRLQDERRILTKHPTRYNDFQWSGRCTDF